MGASTCCPPQPTWPLSLPTALSATCTPPSAHLPLCRSTPLLCLAARWWCTQVWALACWVHPQGGRAGQILASAGVPPGGQGRATPHLCSVECGAGRAWHSLPACPRPRHTLSPSLPSPPRQACCAWRAPRTSWLRCWRTKARTWWRGMQPSASLRWGRWRSRARSSIGEWVARWLAGWGGLCAPAGGSDEPWLLVADGRCCPHPIPPAHPRSPRTGSLGWRCPRARWPPSSSYPTPGGWVGRWVGGSIGGHRNCVGFQASACAHGSA